MICNLKFLLKKLSELKFVLKIMNHRSRQVGGTWRVKRGRGEGVLCCWQEVNEGSALQTFLKFQFHLLNRSNLTFKMNKASLGQVLSRFYGEYMKSTPKRLKIVDAYLFYILLTGIVQFVYCCLVGSFPFNSFLSGFISTVSCFVLAGKLWFKKK